MKLPHLKPRIRNVPLSPFQSQPGGGAFARSSTAHLRVRGRALQARNARIALRDMYTCRACGRVTDKREGEVDHRTPLALGGSDDPNNLQWLCIDCHRLKTQRENAQGCM
jgi:5-methylcytosine-specific restriction enzyme A